MFFLRSVKNWLTLLFIALVGIAALVMWFYVVPSLEQRLVDQRLAEIRNNAQVVRNTMAQLIYLDRGTLRVGEYAAVVSETHLLENSYSARVVLIDATTNQLIVDTSAGTAFALSDYPMYHRSVILNDTAQGTVDVGGQSFAVTAVPVVAATDIGPAPMQPSAVVLIIASLRGVRSAVTLVERRIGLATMLALGVSLFAGYFAAYFIARRLKRIERSADTIAGGDFDTAVRVRLTDEIGQLGMTFNTMGERLRSAFGQIEREKAQVELLLNDLSEGVVGVTADGRIGISNPAAGELLGCPLPAGAALAEVFPEEVARIWDDSRESGADEEVVFEHGRQTLEAVTYPVGSGGDYDSLVVLRDVSEQARLERARRDFIANASHEFKTPLFSLAGFIELLDEGELSGDERIEFLQLMRQQVERLRDLSLSLLDLSMVESGSLQIHPEPTDLVDVVASVLDEFQVQASSRDLRLAVEHGEAPEIAWCDGQRLAQVIRALVDNAVKFTPQGGTVVARVGGDDRAGQIEVEDTGPGIPSSELARIFERFYRGSDSRAGKAGTGLGLSIARELVELMGGKLEVASPSGRGACFVLRLPRHEQSPRKNERGKAGRNGARAASEPEATEVKNA